MMSPLLAKHGLVAKQQVVLVVGGVTLALALAGCGGGGAKAAAVTSSTPASTSVSASATASSPDAGAAAAGFAKYAACLQAHGAPVPSFSPGTRPSGSPRPTGGFSRPPGGGFGGPDGSADPSTSAARAACASLRPQGGGFGGARTISAATFAAFKSCMTDQGVTITSTDPQQAIRGLDRVDPKTVAALKVCQPILGQGQGQAPSAPSSSAAPSA